MILCSKIAFLNVLSQMLSTKELVEATYYVPDSSILEAKRGTAMKLTDRVKFDEAGRLVHERGYINNTMSTYVQIHSYCPTLDPLAYTTSLLDNVNLKDATPEERYVASLKSDDALYKIYEWMILQPPEKGNGEMIIVYENYQSLWEFGHIVAEYLSTYFGFDIIYLDRIYNQYIRGNKRYFGNKKNAQKTIKICYDRKLVNGVVNAMAGSAGDDGLLNNLSIYLATLKWEKLRRTYELLFPNEPLPVGNYTESRLREILEGKLNRRASNLFGSPYEEEIGGVIPTEYEDAIDDNMDDLKYMY